MKIAILIPSRGRPEGARRIIESGYRLAAHPENVEFIVRLDWDDPALSATLKALPNYSKAIIGSPLRGYLSLHEYTNDCAASSTADWLCGMNDDADFISNDWDLAIPTASGKQVLFPRVLIPQDRSKAELEKHAERDRLDFPIISRELYRAIGCYCPVSVMDWFWYGAIQKKPFLSGAVLEKLIMEHRYERTQFLTTQLTVDELPQVIEYRSPENQKLIQSAYAKI